MKEVHKNFFIGNDTDCDVCRSNPEFSIIHACKTCHQRALRYSGSLPSSHPNYLILEDSPASIERRNLYLNMVDMSNELLPEFTNPIFKQAIAFINREIQTKKVLIHCNLGMSRSPSIGLVYLAKTGIISKKSFAEAVNEFVILYPRYSPGTGILSYMQYNWDYLMNEL